MLVNESKADGCFRGDGSWIDCNAKRSHCKKWHFFPNADEALMKETFDNITQHLNIVHRIETEAYFFWSKLL